MLIFCQPESSNFQWKLPKVQQMVADVVAQFGRVDVLVDNTGLSRPGPLFDLTMKNWEPIIRVNLNGLFFTLQAVAKQMVAQVPDDVKKARGAVLERSSTSPGWSDAVDDLMMRSIR
jgi:NAD(P)-dependent dehydrogenase (short-subunit alcohol dehydrogenase family)